MLGAVSEEKGTVLCSAASLSPGSATEGCESPAMAVACWEHGRWPTRFVCSQCAFCVLCSGRACVWPARREPACLPCAGSAGARQRTREMTPSQRLSISGKSLWTHVVRNRGEFPCRMKRKPAVQVESGTPESMVSQSFFVRKVEKFMLEGTYGDHPIPPPAHSSTSLECSSGCSGPCPARFWMSSRTAVSQAHTVLCPCISPPCEHSFP